MCVTMRSNDLWYGFCNDQYCFSKLQKMISNELNIEVAGIDVEEGDLLLFPGYLPHKVAKNESDDDRIVISFNVDVK